MIRKFFTDHSYRNVYIIIGILMFVSYPIMKSLFIDQRAWDYVLNSQLTLNLIIMFGLWGGFYRMVIKVKNPILDKVVWFAGFVVIVLVLRFFGMRTIFG